MPYGEKIFQQEENISELLTGGEFREVCDEMVTTIRGDWCLYSGHAALFCTLR